ncbi:hypothetical protein BO86DRAFT_144703 [Aspergillus japonicus CBS 114.51]|uniref:Uncharacterized protein n=1 Tax=Aspergillus japonicus CBS 114.51 TaxID=1448312 RepID=A0A8T8WVF1_ASPJA|nr:hypothetical protein BO86DRAFT_144703 [Aspergillus japonicus CBS 114.51]RAH79806.1 hypothetical protein BO86DRAFT_144703 [Aspergillus japonicus CBS 114.51]
MDRRRSSPSLSLASTFDPWFRALLAVGVGRRRTGCWGIPSNLEKARQTENGPETFRSVFVPFTFTGSCCSKSPAIFRLGKTQRELEGFSVVECLFRFLL